ncbi:MAG: phosphate signaling complex protein PhoU [Deltaproteobacteria bacterium]|nr:phosphate signaling complex protein PhoU [Deltaproteobacteria bacterium]
MARHLQSEMDKLKELSFNLCADVEESVQKAVQALEERNPSLAETVIAHDGKINKSEVELEEECLKILALHQPVANDLRFVIAVLKLNNDLERIGDLAVNIAERVLFLSQKDPVTIPFDFATMADKTKRMVQKAHRALVNRDADLAREVCMLDDEVDEMNREVYKHVEEGVRNHPDKISSMFSLLSAARHLERIADHATNIAEDVIYMVDGEIVRHRTEDFQT